MVTPTTARLMQATRAQLMRPTAARQWGLRTGRQGSSQNSGKAANESQKNVADQFAQRRFVYRENRVPFYQRLHQNHDGKRQWWKTNRSAFLIYPFYTMMFTSLFLSTWGVGRMVLGHKTWWYNK